MTRQEAQEAVTQAELELERYHREHARDVSAEGRAELRRRRARLQGALEDLARAQEKGSA